MSCSFKQLSLVALKASIVLNISANHGSRLRHTSLRESCDKLMPLRGERRASQFFSSKSHPGKLASCVPDKSFLLYCSGAGSAAPRSTKSCGEGSTFESDSLVGLGASVASFWKSNYGIYRRYRRYRTRRTTGNAPIG